MNTGFTFLFELLNIEQPEEIFLFIVDFLCLYYSDPMQSYRYPLETIT